MANTAGNSRRWLEVDGNLRDGNLRDGSIHSRAICTENNGKSARGLWNGSRLLLKQEGAWDFHMRRAFNVIAITPARSTLSDGSLQIANGSFQHELDH